MKFNSTLNDLKKFDTPQNQPTNQTNGHYQTGSNWVK